MSQFITIVTETSEVVGVEDTQALEVVEIGNGLSAYQIAVIHGFVGTEAEWLASLQGGGGGGSETTTTMGALINSATAKAVPVDADMFSIRDSVTGLLQKLSWVNLKAAVKTYADTLYVALTGNQTIAGVKTFSSSPVVPTPTTEFQAATKGFVESMVDIARDLLANNRWTAKGDLLAGTADSTATQVAVGTDGQILTADSAEAAGVKWGDIPAGISAEKIGDGSVDNTEFGYLSGVDSGPIQSQINEKVTRNTLITGATKTKITYDSKGLVTAGADATTSDIAEGSNLYHTVARVRAVVLTGLSLATSQVIAATDTVLQALGYLQAQITALTTTVSSKAADSAVVHNTGNETVAGIKTFTSDPLIPDEAYDATAWNGSLEPPTKNSVRDEIEAVKATIGGGGYSDEQAQDAAAALFTPDDGDIDYTYNDATPSVTSTIKAAAVTLAKMAAVATGTIFYRKTAGSGDPEVQTLATLKTDLGLTGTNSGDETASTLGATINGAAAATPNNTDLVATVESSVVKKITWTNVKAFLKTYFDTLYPSGSGTSTGTNTGDQTSVSGNAGTATTLQTARNIDGQSFNGSADITVIAPGTVAATSKTTPVDADVMPIADSAASNVLKKLTWANLKATLKTYLDTLYQPLDGDLTTIAGLTATTDNFLVSVASAWASRTPAQVRTTLGLVIGTNVQAYDADLDTWATKTAPSGTVLGTTDTQTLTNKTLIDSTNVVEEITTTASSATPTPTGGSLRNFFTVTALAAGATFAAPSGTPVNGNYLMMRIKDNGTARTLAYNAIYRAIGVTLPTTTVISKTLYIGCRYNSADSKWDVLAVGQEA